MSGKREVYKFVLLDERWAHARNEDIRSIGWQMSATQLKTVASCKLCSVCRPCVPFSVLSFFRIFIPCHVIATRPVQLACCSQPMHCRIFLGKFQLKYSEPALRWLLAVLFSLTHHIRCALMYLINLAGMLYLLVVVPDLCPLFEKCNELPLLITFVST